MIEYIEMFMGLDPGALDSPAGYMISGVILVTMLSALLRVIFVFFEGWFGR